MIQVRAATPDDLDVLVGLWHELEAVQGPLRLFPPARDARERVAASFSAAVGAQDADVLIVEEGGEAIGMALVRLERPSRLSDEVAAELSRVVIRAGRRRTGAGRALVRAAEDWARTHGVDTLVASIFVANEPSRRFWRGIGFEPWVERVVRPVRGG